jgi:hypothetical protein
MTPAIVVIAYNRPQALQRLLSSLAAANYPDDAEVSLVISIDRDDDRISPAVAAVANAFEWRFGPKQVIEQPRHLGLVEAFWTAGRLSSHYEAIVLLEDDMVVAPPFYQFALQALKSYAADPRIAAICLYGLWFNGFTHLPMQPLQDGNDVFFARVPHLQGYVLSAEQWRLFDEWWQQNGPTVRPDPALHPAFLSFRGDEWLPALASYLAREDRYFCFPRVSLAVGWGDPGVHFDSSTDWFLTPLQLGGEAFRLPPIDESLAVYDSFFELTPDRLRALAPALPEVAFDVDLNATKQRNNLQHDYVLTTRPVRRALASFDLRLQPPELNVVQPAPGDAIALAKVEDVYWDRWAGLEARRRLEALAWSKRRPSRRRSLTYQLARMIQRFRRLAKP